MIHSNLHLTSQTHHNIYILSLNWSENREYPTVILIIRRGTGGLMVKTRAF